jgi:hypothetical protein
LNTVGDKFHTIAGIALGRATDSVGYRVVKDMVVPIVGLTEGWLVVMLAGGAVGAAVGSVSLLCSCRS